ncbi:MAG: low molecular weight phosphotyrosine protein phosphatase [Parachlamydiales bacterium]|nr:low molecular weight phosphotyrosine protein phosphatase [Parachlamydiales bacterium]
MPSILFVCQANICRSPAAEAIFKYLAKQRGLLSKLNVSSCAISADKLGSHPDPRMCKTLEERRIDIDGEAKLFKLAYFHEYDYILAADHLVLNVLHYRARSAQEHAKIHLMTEFCENLKGQDIPDPYRKAGLEGFEEVCDILIVCCHHLLDLLYPNSAKKKPVRH